MTHDNPDSHQTDADLLAAPRDEFPDGAAEFTDEVSRRRFMTIMGASIALAGAGGCNIRPASQRKIVPYTTQPDEITPGVPLFFATAAPLAGYGSGVLVRSHEGRPIKIEGNPDHPSSLGGASAFSLASVLDLYDPDRSRGVTHRGLATSYEQAVAAVRKELFPSGQPKAGARVRIVTETVTSPTLAGQIQKILDAFPNARWVQYDAVGRDNIREGIRRAFGRPLNAIYDFKKADVVVSLDADFLGSGPGHVRYSRDFASRRKVRSEDFFKHAHGEEQNEYTTADKMSRLYAVECMPTSTGASADHRLALPAGQVEQFARALAAELAVAGAPPAGTVPDAIKAWIKPLADDLRAANRKGRCAVVVGDHQPASLHALGFAINAVLGAIGQTVTLTAPLEARPEGKVIDLKTLTAEMTAKEVDALFVMGGNPAYSAPADVPFAAEIKNVPFKVHFGTHQDETAVLCEWHVPEAHYLETWGDIRGHDGTITIQQPLIAPLYSGKSAIEFIADVTAAPFREGYEIVRGTWQGWFASQKRSDTFETVWQEAVRAGVVAGAAPAAEANTAIAASFAANWTTIEGDNEINFRADPTLYDGRFANNGWLQELPKPITKLTWDNAVFMSQKTAEQYGIEKSFRWTGGEHGRAEVSVVEVKFRDRTVKAPVWVLPGHADNAVTVHLGSGRARAGRVATTPDDLNADGKPVRGFNAYGLRTSDAPWTANGATITKTGETYFLACTQARWSSVERDPISGHESDRKPIRRGSLDDYRKYPEFAKIPPVAAGETHEINENVPHPKHDHDEKHEHHAHDARLKELTMYYPSEKLSPGLREEQQRRWAMAIDLSACTGCSACVVACQSENNSPVVGKREVTRGRAMHWINIDRYYGGTQDNPNPNEISFQPRMCVQCENAPCEIVCPVGATVHSTDGLNDMVYNRCVGTRYCSNNCPYKVRRFNFLSFADWDTDTLKLGRNPDVSVRSRGVMEKCTFCVQRIRGVEIVAEREARPIKDGEILTACQSACPSGAIVFGDLNDAHSVVSRWKSQPTNYGLLAELNTRPRLSHLAALRNPNPAMPKGA